MKKSELLGISAMVLLGALAQGCEVVDSSQVSSSTVFADYSANYSEETGTIGYSAHFSVGGPMGTSLELDQNSSVLFDGNSMSEDREILFNDVYYVGNYPGTYQDALRNHEFTFRDQSGNLFKNDFSFPVLVEVAGGISSASLNGFSVSWVASGAMDPNDTVTAVLTRSDGTGAKATAYPSGAQNGTLTFQAQDLQQLGSTQVQLNICHEHDTSSIQGDSSGGYLAVSSCSRSVSMMLQ